MTIFITSNGHGRRKIKNASLRHYLGNAKTFSESSKDIPTRGIVTINHIKKTTTTKNCKERILTQTCNFSITST